ncbi:zinc-binding dehydrogenase [Phycicoccus sp. Soil802]|uniref:zinc-binding dehydrogenase n=1 Tax=Phycicoccus sp. Soil802 TaxID=1736414 RepID=UPI001910A67E|nr:zinc-binding dehydrogenase [Phycicoccus sp. Soil802]
MELLEFNDPTPGPGEVVVAVRASGMCGSDLRFYRDPPGGDNTTGATIAGHEPAGVVHAVGPGVDPGVAAVGDRVMVHHYVGCSVCDLCRSGWPQMCRRALRVFGTHIHGAHAPLLRAPAATIVPLDDSLSFEAGAAIACGTGTAWGGLHRLGDLAGTTVAVFGQGPVGLSATLLATALGARVIAIDPVAGRRDSALRAGAHATLDPEECDVRTAVEDVTHGAGVASVLETSGASRAIADGLELLAPWGRIALVGLGGEVRFPVLGAHRRQISVLPSISMSIMAQRQCAEFVVSRNVDIDGLFTHRWRLEQVAEAYEWFAQQDAGKGVIVFDS